MFPVSLRFSMPLVAALATADATAARFDIDPKHTYPSLEMSHRGISVWRGKFNRTTGSIELDLAARTGQVDVRIDTSSIDFGLDAMNEHALADDWLNPKQFPEIRYQGELVFTGEVPTAIEGELTLLGVSKPVRIDIAKFKCIENALGDRDVCGADATAEFHRADFGLTRWADGDAGRIFVRIQVEAAEAAASEPSGAPTKPD